VLTKISHLCNGTVQRKPTYQTSALANECEWT
jgi:hypothetical protein